MQNLFITALLALGAFTTLTTATADDSSYTDHSKLKKAMLDSHNKYRPHHRVGPVSWNPELAKYAQQHTANCVFEHSNHGPYGENLAMGYSTPTAAAQDWYKEHKVYNYNGDWQEAAGHFTQMVWKGTSEIGCGATNCPGKGWYLTCEYKKQGNVLTQFKKNVFPPK